MGRRSVRYSPHTAQPVAYSPIVTSRDYHKVPSRPPAPPTTDSSLYLSTTDVVKRQPLGSGTTGVVYRGEWRNLDVAIKELRDVNSTLLQEEAQRLANLRPHKHIVVLYGVMTNPPALVLEYCSGGSLDVALYGPTPLPFDPKTLLSIARGCALGLEHMHAEHLVHRDVAARNVLLDEYKSPKLTDFGMSRASEFSERVTVSTKLPVKWAAPEQIEQSLVSKASDIFSFGCLLWEIFEQSPPWPGMTAAAAAQAVRTGQRMRPTKASAAHAQLMARCWAHERGARPPAAVVVTSLKQTVYYEALPSMVAQAPQAYDETGIGVRMY
jgi:serine/threonine protein kinase